MKTVDPEIDDRKIRIAYLINHFGQGGGTENQLTALIKNIDRSRFEPCLIIMQPLWEVMISLFEKMKLELDCKVVFLDITSFASLRAPFALWRVVRLLRKRRIDILQMFFFDARIFGAVAGKLAGVEKIVACRRDFGYNASANQMKILRFFNRFVDHILVNANRVAGMVAETEKFPLNKITCVYNGVEIVSTGNPCPLESNGVILDPNRPVVGIVANLRPVKRIDRFLQMASRIKDKSVQFVIIGKGKEPEKYYKMARELGLADRTYFKSIIHDVDKVMQSFTVGVLTSQSEGLSNSLIELSLNGIPTVAFDVGGNVEIIEDGKTGFILPDDDVAGLTEKVEYLLENPKIAIEMGKQGKIRAEKLFSMKKMVKSTEDFYLQILNMSETKQIDSVREIHGSK
jgi:glycosyltransferase involved in cell wall biosynthesis